VFFRDPLLLVVIVLLATIVAVPVALMVWLFVRWSRGVGGWWRWTMRIGAVVILAAGGVFSSLHPSASYGASVSSQPYPALPPSSVVESGVASCPSTWNRFEAIFPGGTDAPLPGPLYPGLLQAMQTACLAATGSYGRDTGLLLGAGVLVIFASVVTRRRSMDLTRSPATVPGWF
jgi:hypothetical protein